MWSVWLRGAARLVCLALCAVGACDAASAAPHAEALIEAWREQNTLCRGLPGDDPRSVAACEKRQGIGRDLGRLGWCYGKRDQLAYQMQWHRCEAASLRPE